MGSVEDWYFINNIDVMQSMHIDLIQFQTMDQFMLNVVPKTKACTFYNVDFFMKFANRCRNPITIGNQTL